MKSSPPDVPAIEQARTVRVEEYARLKGVSKWTIHNWIRDGWIPSIKVAKTILIPLKKAEAALSKFMREGVVA
jgi:excisionase family DNA binding protein